MRLALYQGPSPAGDVAAAFEAVESALSAASAMNADIAVFPEIFLPGYNVPAPEAQPLDGGWVGRLRAAARDAGVALVIGMAERAGGVTYNSAVAIGPDGGLLANYRKLQLFGAREKSLYAPGDAYVVFPFRNRRIGLLICYDIEFPEHLRAIARHGADLVLVPTANMPPFDNVNRITIAARALDHGVTLAYCNYCGVEGDLTYVGRSVIAGPDGEPIALAGPETTLLIADVPEPMAVERPTLTNTLEDLRAIEKLGDGSASLPTES
ncbi:MAG: carbon-nitrogen hydrolase family protein [Kiloniellales bacterium]|nr:carbon-nitrogen hydrolase family protein [Kiloniellales bacterium]